MPGPGDVTSAGLVNTSATNDVQLAPKTNKEDAAKVLNEIFKEFGRISEKEPEVPSAEGYDREKLASECIPDWIVENLSPNAKIAIAAGITMRSFIEGFGNNRPELGL